MAASVPDSDSLRRAALQASWQRGRWVARRRLWWRWTAWALLRYVLPALAALTVLGGLAYGLILMTRSPTLAREPATAMPASTPPVSASVSASVSAPVSLPASAPATPPAAATAATPTVPAGVEPEPAVVPPAGHASLRIDWSASPGIPPKTARTSASSPASAPTTNVGDSRP